MIELRGTFELALAPTEAIGLFTPEGERRWAQGWDPQYPDGRSLEPGTVFTTAHGGVDTVWIITGREPLAMRYARVAPGLDAATVGVRCLPGPAEGTTVVEVEYRMTGLTEEGAHRVCGLADGYAKMLRAWQDAIAASHIC